MYDKIFVFTCLHIKIVFDGKYVFRIYIREGTITIRADYYTNIFIVVIFPISMLSVPAMTRLNIYRLVLATLGIYVLCQKNSSEHISVFHGFFMGTGYMGCG